MNWGTTTVRWHRRVPRARRSSPVPGRVYQKPVYRNDVICRLYWIYVWDPRTNYTTITLGYIGETSRGDPLVRFGEHVGDGTANEPGQPWADTIPERDPQLALAKGYFMVSEQVFPNKEAAWAAEEATTVKYRPLYPYEYNQNNPDRITIPDARAARAERDERNGVPLEQRWATLFAEYQRRRGAEVDAGRGRLFTLDPRRWSAAWRRRSGWSAGWAGPTVGLWGLAARYAPIVSTLRLGGLAAALVALALLWWTRRRGGPWRRAGNQLARLALIVAMGWLLWPAVFGPR